MPDVVSNKDLYTALQSTRSELVNMIQSLDAKIESTYVSSKEFAPVKALVYGLVGLVMMAVGTALVATVLRAAAQAGIL